MSKFEFYPHYLFLPSFIDEPYELFSVIDFINWLAIVGLFNINKESASSCSGASNKGTYIINPDNHVKGHLAMPLYLFTID